MHNENLYFWTHSHTFGQDKKRHGEVRTIIVIAITSVMMIIEIGTGIVFCTLALLADGMHMAYDRTLSINAQFTRVNEHFWRRYGAKIKVSWSSNFPINRS